MSDRRLRTNGPLPRPRDRAAALRAAGFVGVAVAPPPPVPPRRWEIKVLGLPNLQAKQHHMVTHRERKNWGELTIWALKQAGVRRPLAQLLEHATVEFTRHTSAPVSCLADDDNLAISFKAHRDALVGWLLKDDTPAVLRARYGYGGAPARGGFVRMVIEEGWGDACPMCGRAND